MATKRKTKAKVRGRSKKAILAQKRSAAAKKGWQTRRYNEWKEKRRLRPKVFKKLKTLYGRESIGALKKNVRLMSVRDLRFALDASPTELRQAAADPPDKISFYDYYDPPDGSYDDYDPDYEPPEINPFWYHD